MRSVRASGSPSPSPLRDDTNPSQGVGIPTNGLVGGRPTSEIVHPCVSRFIPTRWLGTHGRGSPHPNLKTREPEQNAEGVGFEPTEALRPQWFSRWGFCLREPSHFRVFSNVRRLGRPGWSRLVSAHSDPLAVHVAVQNASHSFRSHQAVQQIDQGPLEWSTA